MTHNRKQVFKQYHAALTPPTKYPIVLLKRFPSVWYVWPLLLLGVAFVPCGLFWWFDDEIYHKQLALACPIDAIRVSVLAWWGHPADSRKAMNLLHWAMHTILYWRIVVAIEMASKLVIVVCVVISNVWMTFLELSFKKSELLLLLLSSTNVLNVQTLFYENPNRKWIANELLMGTRTWCKAWVPNEDSWQLPYSGISENHNKDTLPNFDVTATFLRNCDSLQNIFSIWVFTPTQSKCSHRVSPHHLPTSL